MTTSRINVKTVFTAALLTLSLVSTVNAKESTTYEVSVTDQDGTTTSDPATICIMVPKLCRRD
ncbi:hypothetical protein LHL20_05635 [Alteromonas sp. McT4-15]|uniref:hypothetical protein n=1 Tax=unclassified Alteromonas TaxID=2614992 RepID=UPI0019237A44|nr:MULTISPECIES: hypothetical protein [unclassified Alteromonas]MEC8233072.1 hypothetical protein [Pseudomonadota bacterium]MCB4435725.1 hypothetical protein [Alteromonas sp. McT4-15]WDT86367.1 hypothetical protein OZ660_01055 [Alteromonas sp. 009811495]BCO17348.1 hypothetical protein KUC3_02050 [Alteromonas sp. KC3]BCO21337.1 hypothetical protein KUC14_02060 [Alteromonas sp. KC14]